LSKLIITRGCHIKRLEGRSGSKRAGCADARLFLPLILMSEIQYLTSEKRQKSAVSRVAKLLSNTARYNSEVQAKKRRLMATSLFAPFSAEKGEEKPEQSAER